MYFLVCLFVDGIIVVSIHSDKYPFYASVHKIANPGICGDARRDGIHIQSVHHSPLPRPRKSPGITPHDRTQTTPDPTHPRNL